jgi:hypothetical protein
MKKKKKQINKNKDNLELEDYNSKFEKKLYQIIAIVVIIWLLWSLAKYGGRGYDHFIGEPIEYRLPLQRK